MGTARAAPIPGAVRPIRAVVPVPSFAPSLTSPLASSLASRCPLALAAPLRHLPTGAGHVVVHTTAGARGLSLGQVQLLRLPDARS